MKFYRTIRGGLVLWAGGLLALILVVAGAVLLQPETMTPSVLALCGAGVLLASLLGLWWITGKVIGPLDKIRRASAEIADGDLSARIEVSDGEDEISKLGGLLNQTFSRLDESTESMRRFTSDASHELRTPLSVMISEAQATLSRERSPEEYRESLEVCLGSAQEMRDLTSQLLDVSRFDAGKNEAVLRPVDLSELAEHSCDRIRPLAEENEVQLSFAGTSSSILGDETRLAQLLTNLLSNAVRYSRPGDQIGVRVESDSKEQVVRLQVSDTGRGIEEKDLPHIFDRFYRADLSRTQPTGRTGLGLAICKAIVHLHDGTITVESIKNEGSRFLVTFPLAVPSSP